VLLGSSFAPEDFCSFFQKGKEIKFRYTVQSYSSTLSCSSWCNNNTIRSHTVGNMDTAVREEKAMCWIVAFCLCVCASSHYLLLPSPGDSAPSLHLSSWLATICLSTSSSLVSRSNWSSCTWAQQNETWDLMHFLSFMWWRWQIWQMWSQCDVGKIGSWRLSSGFRLTMAQCRSLGRDKQASAE